MSDSRPATYEHIQTVQRFLTMAIVNLLTRSDNHDRSKLHSPEVEVFDEYTDKLKTSTYGSEEYKGFLAGMKPALDHHYSKNRHHPEFHKNGIKGMSFLDLLEMLCDWKAATMRHSDGDLAKSIEINQARFGYSDELKTIMLTTARELNLIKPEGAREVEMKFFDKATGEEYILSEGEQLRRAKTQ